MVTGKMKIIKMGSSYSIMITGKMGRIKMTSSHSLNRVVRKELFISFFAHWIQQLISLGNLLYISMYIGYILYVRIVFL